MTKKDIKIGERFIHDDVTLECVEEDYYEPCKGCFFDQQQTLCSTLRGAIGECDESLRTDHKNVIFKKVE